MVDAFNITQDRIARSRLAGEPPDVMSSPKLGLVGLFEFHQAARAIQLGEEATERALDHGAPGVYNIVDDDPAAVIQWLPVLAEAVGAKPPFRVPAFVGRLVAGEGSVIVMNEIRGASNAKAKRALDWQLIFPSWRDGFRKGLA